MTCSLAICLILKLIQHWKKRFFLTSMQNADAQRLIIMQIAVEYILKIRIFHVFHYISLNWRASEKNKNGFFLLFSKLEKLRCSGLIYGLSFRIQAASYFPQSWVQQTGLIFYLADFHGRNRRIPDFDENKSQDSPLKPSKVGIISVSFWITGCVRFLIFEFNWVLVYFNSR